MSHHIDPALMYRIRSRGVERPAVEGHRLPQLVRDFVLARHDELSEDGELWFSASEVESLFPSAAAARLIRERQHRDPGAHGEEHPTQVEDDRKFPREPWYVARASNVAGPYDQLTITQWYEEGCLRETDQLRPGMHAKWRSLANAENEGLLAPPPANTCSVNPIHLVADPPVWMGPPTTPVIASEEWTPGMQRSGQSTSNSFSSNLPLILASVGAFALFLTSLAGLAWYILNLNRQDSDPAGNGNSERVAARPATTIAGSLPLNTIDTTTPAETERSPSKAGIAKPNSSVQPNRIRSAIPIKRAIAIRWPASAFSLDKQAIHQGSGVYEVSLLKVPGVKRSIEFEITAPDSAGVRDLIAVTSRGDQSRTGTILTEPDRVMFAWSPSASQTVAAEFVLTHEILIRDDTHHSTIQFQISDLAQLPSPPTPVAREFAVSVPPWVPPEFELLLKPTFVSIAPARQIEFAPFFVVAPTKENKHFEQTLDLTSLGDDWIKAAKFVVKADLVGTGSGRSIRFSSTALLSGEGFQAFDWSRRNLAITGLLRRSNEQEMKENESNQVLKTRNDHLQTLERWAERLSCRLELYARVGDREVLCGTTAEYTGARNSTNPFDASR